MDERGRLVQQLKTSHGWLCHVVEPFTNDEASRIPSAGLAPVVWQVGHVAVSEAWFAQGAGNAVALPDGYSNLFKNGTGGPATYPPLAEVVAAFGRSQQVLAELAATADLGAPVALLPQYFKTIGEMLVFSCTHRGYHAGKVTSLRTLLGTAKVGA